MMWIILLGVGGPQSLHWVKNIFCGIYAAYPFSSSNCMQSCHEEGDVLPTYNLNAKSVSRITFRGPFEQSSQQLTGEKDPECEQNPFMYTGKVSKNRWGYPNRCCLFPLPTTGNKNIEVKIHWENFYVYCCTSFHENWFKIPNIKFYPCPMYSSSP